jgi:Ran-binding protein 1
VYVGDCKLLKHKASGKIRFLMRQEKTAKIVANHYVVENESFCNLKPNAGEKFTLVWSVFSNPFHPF